MHTLEIRCTVTNPDGFYYRESHEWGGLVDGALPWFQDTLAGLLTQAQDLAGKGKGEHVAEFVSILDGNAQSIVVSGLSYKDVVKMQKAFARKEAELLDIADAK